MNIQITMANTSIMKLPDQFTDMFIGSASHVNRASVHDQIGPIPTHDPERKEGRSVGPPKMNAATIMEACPTESICRLSNMAIS